MRDRSNKVWFVVGASAFLMVCTPGAGKMIEDAMDATSVDAAAQTCASCTAGGAMRVITADTDPDRLTALAVTAVSQPAPTMITSGPFVLTDAQLEYVTATSAVLFIDSSCAEMTLTSYVVGWISVRDREIHGARVIIPAGQHLCALQNNSNRARVSVAGFRPYD